MRKVLGIFGGVVAVTAGVSLFFTNQLMYMKRKSDEQIEELETKTTLYSREEFYEMKKEKLAIPSEFGYMLNGYFIPNEGSSKYVICCHGVTTSHVNAVKYALLFWKRGFNVIIYDHRRHGESGGKTTSYGYYEKRDLKAVVQWVRNYGGEDAILGIHGESMGACTLLQYAGDVADGADFYIADCPFSDLYGQLKYRLKEDYKLPAYPLLPLADYVLKLRDGYRVQDVSPLKAVENISQPVLFIHSINDKYIPSYMTEELYKRKKGEKDIYLAKNGGHAKSYAENTEEYEAVIDAFLAKWV